MEIPPFWWYLPGNIGIFHGYVSLQECMFQLYLWFNTGWLAQKKNLRNLRQAIHPPIPSTHPPIPSLDSHVIGSLPKRVTTILREILQNCHRFLQVWSPQNGSHLHKKVWKTNHTISRWIKHPNFPNAPCMEYVPTCLKFLTENLRKYSSRSIPFKKNVVPVTSKEYFGQRGSGIWDKEQMVSTTEGRALGTWRQKFIGLESIRFLMPASF